MKRSYGLAGLALPLLCAVSGASLSQHLQNAPFSLAGTYRPSAAMLGFERHGPEPDAWRARASIAASADLKLTARFTDHERTPGQLPESMTAWVLGANYSLASGNLQVGYGRSQLEGTGGTRQFSIGYEVALSKRVSVFADVAEKRSVLRMRHLDLGVRAAF